MKFEKINFISLFLLILGLGSTIGQQAFSQNAFPEKGVYDGKIGSDPMILVVGESDAESLKGNFVMNRGMAVEESHPFSLSTTGNHLIFQSDLYVGKMKSPDIKQDNFSGTLSLFNKKKIFFFGSLKWKNNIVPSTPVCACAAPNCPASE